MSLELILIGVLGTWFILIGLYTQFRYTQCKNAIVTIVVRNITVSLSKLSDIDLRLHRADVEKSLRKGNDIERAIAKQVIAFINKKLDK